MERRKFVALGSASLCMMPLIGFSAFTPSKNSMALVKPSWLIDLIKINDTYVKGSPASKITDPTNKYFGAYLSGYGIPNPSNTAWFINVACAALSSEESVYYQSQDQLKEILDALNGLLKLQHADGTIDLVDTNFHSTPDTSFMVKRLVQSYNLLQQSKTKGVEKVLPVFETFLKRAGEALITGGIHTPNHRWVVSAALTKLYELWPDKRYLNRVNQWLAEHIDLDPDGQYTEKSTGGYSAVIDRVLITVAKGLHKPELYEPVRKNLKMMRYYMHPNGEVVTEASNRQDKGQIGTMESYYYACRYLALLDNDGELASICRMVEKKYPNSLMGSLNYFLEDPTQWKELPASKSLPTSYVKSFPYSGVVRIRRENWDTTLLSNNPGWLTFHKGNAILQGMRIASSFFGKGQFQSEKIEQVGNTWVLNKKLEGPYFQPFEPQFISPDGDLGKMPKSNRKQSNVQYLETTITIAEENNGMSIQIEMNGTENVPVSLELIFREGGNFSGVEPAPNKANAYVLKGKTGTYTVGTDAIEFGPGTLPHTWLQLRGALPAMDSPTVYLTGFTPFKHTIKLS